MPLKPVAIAFLVPPTALVIVAVIGLLMGARAWRLGRLFAWAGVLALLVLAIPAVSGSLLGALEDDLPLTPPPDAPPQAIVILGGEVHLSRGQPPSPLPGPLSLERIRAGAALHRRTGLPILITGGPPIGSDIPIATVMADSLEHDFQVPVQWTEKASRDTWENARLSAAILREHHISSVYVVTHAWHERRALIAFAGTGIKMTAAPTQLDRTPTTLLTDFLPDVAGWGASYLAFHEWIGLAWYSLR